MAGCEVIELTLGYWTDSVGTFDPEKALFRIKKAFPTAVLDPTDHQEVRMVAEVEHWNATEMTEERRERFIMMSKKCYRTNGPTYRFEIPAEPLSIKGDTRRYRIRFELPQGTAEEVRQRVISFLETLRLGEPQLSVSENDAGNT
ncbi:MAG TPA: hypothetical protein VGZ22_24105 [Isosphaeraceae bacterium]|jgi:hypothetical protein|nr:hypothetical protein [Isosphaeraceae bacterium]